MAQQIINVGGSPNDGTGDGIRTGGEKINSNFTELYGSSSFGEFKLRGEQIIANQQFASLGGESGTHTSQIMAHYVQGEMCVLVTYKDSSKYLFKVRNAETNEIVLDENWTNGGTAWTNRMHEISDTVVRLTYSKFTEDIYYRDYNTDTNFLGAEARLPVAFRLANGIDYGTPSITFGLNEYLEHCFNCTGIDYRDSAYDTWADRKLQIADVQQLQRYDNKYWLILECLADTTPFGDTGGIGCPLWTTDFVNYYANPPIFMTTDLNEQRDHEQSITRLGGVWHSLSRYNKFDTDNSGYKYYTSPDAETWTPQGLSNIPSPWGGIRHGVHLWDIRKANPSGTNSNKTTTQVALIIYQKLPDTYAVYEYDDTTHKLRTKLGLAYTTDYVNWTEVAEFNDRSSIHYPSIWVYDDIAYFCWSSSVSGTNFVSSIRWSKYNLGSIT